MVLPEEEYDPVRSLRAARRRRHHEPEERGFSFVIRDATAADMPDVRAIYNHYVANSTVTFDETPVTQAQQRAKFLKGEKHGWPFLVAATPNGEIVGYASVAGYRDRSAYRYTVEDSIYLGPAATGKGVGKALLTELIARAKAAGLKEIVAIIADSGADASIGLHTSLGFREVGRMGRVGYKFGRWLGTVMMQKSLK